MNDMKWETLSLDALRPAAYNPRKKLKSGDKEYEKIKNSILEFGYVEPIIVNYDMTVIGGHQRLTVLKDLGYTEALAELETILDRLEHDEPDVDRVADDVARAAELVAHCRDRITAARARVQEVVGDLDPPT